VLALAEPGAPWREDQLLPWSRAMGEPSGRILAFGDCELDFGRRELRRAGAGVDLQPTPLRLLLYIAEHRDRTVPKQELLDAIWPDAAVGDASLAEALANVREALGDHGDEQRVVRTQRGAGVRFVARARVIDDEHAQPLAVVPPMRASRVTRGWIALAGVLALALGTLAARVAVTPDAPRAFPPFGVAVLPLRSLTAGARNLELADGLTEQITSALAQNGYPVVARTTASLYRERAADVRELGPQLGVSHVLEGSVQREGERVRVTVQLVATGSGKHVWSETFEKPARDAFAIQDEVTDRVAVQFYWHASQDGVAMERDSELARLSDRAIELRKLFLEERYEDALVIGEQLLAGAPKREPFSRLRGDTNANLSFVWGNLYVFGNRPFREAGPKLLAHAEAAAELAPDSAWARLSLARAAVHHWQWQRSEQEMRRVCALAPRTANCGLAQWHVCSALGCVEEQLEGARIFLRRVPAEWGAWDAVALALLNQGRLAEAEPAAQRARQLGSPAALHLPSIQWRLGKQAESVAGLQALARGGPADADEIGRLGARDPASAWRVFAERHATADPKPFTSAHFMSAQSFALIGDLEAAMRELERSVADHEPGMEMFGLDPVFEPIRDTPRFRALIRRMGLVDYHAKYLRRARFVTARAAARTRGASARPEAQP
jgi:TolB-like protein/DNA-binding winged helix-turn-helix (wHTH) protein